MFKERSPMWKRGIVGIDHIDFLSKDMVVTLETKEVFT